MKLQDILDVVATTTNTHKSLIVSKARTERVVTARFIYFYMSRKFTVNKAHEIAGFVNRKNADYFYALNQVDKWKSNNIHFRAIFETINSQLILSKH